MEVKYQILSWVFSIVRVFIMHIAIGSWCLRLVSVAMEVAIWLHYVHYVHYMQGGRALFFCIQCLHDIDIVTMAFVSLVDRSGPKVTLVKSM